MIRLGVLTSSRADFGIYLPLLNKLKCDSFFKLEIIAFGTHLSHYHGYTISEIEKNGFDCIRQISSIISNDDEQSVSSSYGLTVLKFSSFWNFNKYDIVLCIGDRFEMSAAVQAGIPFGILFAHIHGGETTLGAIDNIYRHQITLASFLHFTASKIFTSKVVELIGSSKNVYTVGALSLDGIFSFNPLPKSLFYDKFSIPPLDFALITFHPETISPELNKIYAKEMRIALEYLTSYLFLVITMPNADTMGSIFRNEIEELKNNFPDKIMCIENLGKEHYFNAMFYAKLLIGNTSSGIIEAASFGKFVVNVGDRQKGRLQSQNIRNAEFKSHSILEEVNNVLHLGEFKGVNQYYQKGAVQKIIDVLKNI
jgi:GDP/UDP-N,N'-diacetylbacillosamine 2-epimerase (hydrolysing)